MVDEKKEEKKEQKDPTLRQIVRIFQKEIVSNRHETYALRSEIAVMRTEIAAIHKTLVESNIQFISIAESLRGVNAEMKSAGDSLQKALESLKETAVELADKFDVTNDVELDGEELEDLLSRGLPLNSFETSPIPSIKKIEDDEPVIESNEPCTFKTNGDNGKEIQCCKRKGHKGDHMFKCESPKCPGYPFIHTSPHPINTCPPNIAENKVDEKGESR